MSNSPNQSQWAFDEDGLTNMGMFDSFNNEQVPIDPELLFDTNNLPQPPFSSHLYNVTEEHEYTSQATFNPQFYHDESMKWLHPTFPTDHHSYLSTSMPGSSTYNAFGPYHTPSLGSTYGASPGPSLDTDNSLPPRPHLKRRHTAPPSHSPEPPEQYSTPAANANEMRKWGYKKGEDGGWACNFPNCRSSRLFYRACDLRKHYKRHCRDLYCRHKGCPQSTGKGFSSVKDRARHEARHNPSVHCDWEGCPRVFSRRDNMRDHYRRIHVAQLQSMEAISPTDSRTDRRNSL